MTNQINLVFTTMTNMFNAFLVIGIFKTFFLSCIFCLCLSIVIKIIKAD